MMATETVAPTTQHPSAPQSKQPSTDVAKASAAAAVPRLAHDDGVGHELAGRMEPRHSTSGKRTRGGAETVTVKEPRSARRRGPNTEAGKARVSLNALTHGISSARLVLPGGSLTDWETYRCAIVGTLAPARPVETALAERAASAFWRLRRVTAYEEATLAERQHLELASARLLPHPADLDKIIRYEAHLSRQLYHALHGLEAMRAARRGDRAPLLRVDVHTEAETLAAVDGSTG